jgi:hypothetical protein
MQQVKNRISFTYNYSDGSPWVKLKTWWRIFSSTDACPFYLEIHDAFHQGIGLSA